MSRIVVVLSVVALIGMGWMERAGGDPSAQAATRAALAGHPLVGTWLATTPFGASSETFAADGSFVAAYPVVENGPNGTAYYSPGVGVWESTGERSGHFTSVQAITDADGTSLGTLTIDGYLDMSDDGQRFVDNSPQTTLTYRDAAGAVVAAITPFQGGGNVPPVIGIRIAVGEPGIPVASPVATPGA